MSHGKYFYHNHWCQIDDRNLSYYHPEMTASKCKF